MAVGTAVSGHQEAALGRGTPRHTDSWMSMCPACLQEVLQAVGECVTWSQNVFPK